MTSGAQKAPLSVAGDGGWRGLWRPDAVPPTRWNTGDSALIASLRWRAGRAGITWAELPLRGDGEAWRTRAIVVRIDPARVRFALDTAFTYERDANGYLSRRAAWRTTATPVTALLAVNAGQFAVTLLGTLPWGWVVLEGREWRAPGIGPLSSAVVFDSAGRVSLRSPAEFAGSDRMAAVRTAFQSFPTLLTGDGEVPSMLRDSTAGVDLTHRDARLAIGTRRDGSVLVVLTRFDAFGPTLGAVPFGLTTPETAALMGALGCSRAVMLDGGISAQLQLRAASGAMQRWPGWRRVPMGLLVLPR
ncbi:MAG: phosphodiester glycosidase family protein [Gemmatimonadaceae bacterium]|nr:phosphodiester glycosidase family protein [Gemmatimonadaceae bacterium]